jgi:SAM-dependent methyltransferase
MIVHAFSMDEGRHQPDSVVQPFALAQDVGKAERSAITDLPLPPIKFRHLVGPTEPHEFDAPHARQLFERLPAHLFDVVFDYGCGCGRLARQLVRTGRRPRRYIGIDPHQGMVGWCRENITARAPEFEFQHHNVFQEFMNPDGTFDDVPLPAADGSVSLFLAWSVFTHLLQPNAEFALGEIARVLRPDGLAVTTWFLFDKSDFPMMQPFQNSLYISDFDPTNAVIFDRKWLAGALAAAGLEVLSLTAPIVRGHQWAMHLRKAP